MKYKVTLSLKEYYELEIEAEEIIKGTGGKGEVVSR